ILTDKSLHATAFYDGNSVSHDIFDLNEIRDIKLQKGGSNYASGLKDALSGVQGGQYEKLQFTYKDKKYEYNMLLFVEGYPVFETRKDTMSGEFYRIYKANGEKNAVYDYKNIAFYVDSAFRTNLYAEFKKALGERFNADFAA
ncbi:hypothetical protein LJB87_01550, partial [Alistipes sp. OttesenSCG-928-L06]|nr:hypothetical protein [Alistipes sp. OttesenSCG-928-L06]